MNCFKVIWQSIAGPSKPSQEADPQQALPEEQKHASDSSTVAQPKQGESQSQSQPVWTIESVRLPEFRPPGLEVDDGTAASETTTENPYVTNPVAGPDVAEIDRPWEGNKYFLPKDNTELSRLDRQHIMWRQLLDGDLWKSPIEKPKHVLDMGTGTGIWAMDFAHQHPDADVLGIDLTKPSRDVTPPNCHFEERDFTHSWDYPHKFDYIHGRLIFVAQQNARGLLEQAWAGLAPGGYLEFQEIYGVPLGFDESYHGTYLEQFFFDTVVGSRNLGNDMMTLPHFKTWMAEIGFEDVTEMQYALPLNPWPKGKYKSIGEQQIKNLTVGMGGMYTRMLTKGLGWSPEKAAEHIEKAQEGIQDPNVHGYFPVFVVYGRKPLSSS